MSSSSSDSDSDDFEPIRKIKINIRPKEETVRKEGADVNEIRASVEAWRPLGPPPHSSLSRRQSSLSSMSSLSFGMVSNFGGSGSTTATSFGGTTTNDQGNLQGANAMRSSPSCSSLVNEFNNRSSFSNFMSATSRTASPSTVMNNHNDAVPIAIAIQESIELTVKGQNGPSLSDTKFETRALGNIKVAFPNAFARSIHESGSKSCPALKLRLHSTDNIIRYYASILIKDLELEASNKVVNDQAFNKGAWSNNGSNCGQEQDDQFADLFDLNESPCKGRSSSKVIEFDMEALTNHLGKLYEQSPTSRYYNVDVLRYQIMPIQEFEKCPLQVCSYWKIEPDIIKLRVDFKHSNKCGFNLERLREIFFNVELANFIPPGLKINSLSPDSVSTMRLNNNNNDSVAMDMNSAAANSFQNSLIDNTTPKATGLAPSASKQPAISSNSPSLDDRRLNLSQQTGYEVLENILETKSPSSIQVRIPPPPPGGHSRQNNHANRASVKSSSTSTTQSIELAMKQQPSLSALDPYTPLNQSKKSSNMYSQAIDGLIGLSAATPQPPQSVATILPSSIPPYITHEPQAQWNSNTKQLTWKFDNLLSYYKSDGYGSLLAKIDFRNQSGMLAPKIPAQAMPAPIDIKFMIVDSTLSKVSLSIDSNGYRMSLSKKEIRSGRYKSEPYVF